jgi:hypothetical protein
VKRLTGVSRAPLEEISPPGPSSNFEAVEDGHHTRFGLAHDPVSEEPNANTEMGGFFSSLGSKG